ncbi:MAG TPA: aminoacyl-histidine dipeptidase [Bacteroidales bacterium]|nr:aminoacyl-histidine dipeptidase [Bacteroidales bacterium]
MIIKDLEPNKIWTYFDEICRIPRLSKDEDKIRAYLIEFAHKHNLEVETDSSGNVLIKKPADPGFENRISVVLQSHMDMVGEKNASTVHDWKRDPILPVIDDGWVRAEKNTTLGADDGIGIAAQLTILSDPDVKTGPIECLFTVDEESGMTGALELKPDWLRSKTLINLDSEDEGELFIGCAGGMDTVSYFNYATERIRADALSLEIKLTGLRGGHSGDNIHKGYGNSVKIMNKLLIRLDSLFGIGLYDFTAGNLRNALPREAFAKITFSKESYSKICEYIDEFEMITKEELGSIEPNLQIIYSDQPAPSHILEKQIQEKLNMALDKCPHGVITWSEKVEGLVETSTNLASVLHTDDNKIRVVTSQRSSDEDAKHEISNRIRSIFLQAGAEVEQAKGYPGWNPNTDSEILNLTMTSYRKLFGKDPVVRAIHAGLECGLFLEKYPVLDMISFGPTIKGAHTPQERISIESNQKFWDLLLDVLRNIPEE